MDSSNSKETYFPYIETSKMTRWDLLFRSFLTVKDNADQVLAHAKPKDLTPAELAPTLGPGGVETQATVLMRTERDTAKETWETRNTYAKAQIVRAASRDPSAFLIVQENPKATARKLYYLLHARFNQGSMTSVVQAKLGEFNTMEIAYPETATSFTERIANVRLELWNMDQEYITDDVHCLARLKERGDSQGRPLQVIGPELCHDPGPYLEQCNQGCPSL